MSESRESFEKLRRSYRQLDAADRILFWIHIVVAPLLMFGAVAYAMGLGPAVIFTFGLSLWMGSRP